MPRVVRGPGSSDDVVMTDPPAEEIVEPPPVLRGARAAGRYKAPPPLSEMMLVPREARTCEGGGAPVEEVVTTPRPNVEIRINEEFLDDSTINPVVVHMAEELAAPAREERRFW